MAAAVLPRAQLRARHDQGARNGTAAPTWSRRSAIAVTATRRATSWARRSPASGFRAPRSTNGTRPASPPRRSPRPIAGTSPSSSLSRKNGSANNSTALGPMQEVVHDSLSFLTPGDLDAMASYLLDLAERERPSKPVPVAKKLAPEIEHHAAKLYADNCASCHQNQRSGHCRARSRRSRAIRPWSRPSRYDILAVVLQGIPARGDIPAMPSFAGSLDDGDVADSHQLRAYELGQQRSAECHARAGGDLALDAVVAGLRERCRATVRLPERRPGRQCRVSTPA